MRPARHLVTGEESAARAPARACPAPARRAARWTNTICVANSCILVSPLYTLCHNPGSILVMFDINANYLPDRACGAHGVLTFLMLGSRSCSRGDVSTAMRGDADIASSRAAGERCAPAAAGAAN
jgi:hypothetical protein